jgi:hypothetical protein
MKSFEKGKLSAAQMWTIIKMAQWDGDYERVKSFFKKNLYVDQFKQLDAFVHEMQEQLQNIFHEDWVGNPGINVSDDGWSDLTAEVVGRGNKFYKEITLKKLQEMANSCDYNESFLYAFHVD